jgi:ABC-type uncharacterized transport system permease subunit
MSGTEWLSFGLQTLAAATPLLLASLGETFTERSGVVNIGLEGLLLGGALAAVMVAVLTGAPLLGLAAAVLAGAAGAALFAFFGVALRRDQVIVGATLNFLALGLTGVLYRAWLGTSGGTPQLAPTLPRLLGEGGTALNGLTLFALLLVPCAHVLLFRTRLGVTLRAAGEVPEAAAAGGTAVNRLRVLTLLAAGALAGAGGAALAIGYNNGFTEGMTGGRGFIALAIVVFGRWTPSGALGASLLFAAADVGQARLQAAGTLAIPTRSFWRSPIC